jgi:hypothetical protein
MLQFIYIYHKYKYTGTQTFLIYIPITGNFCGFGLKRRHLIFAIFFSADWKSRHWKKYVCITGINYWSDRTGQLSLEVKTNLDLWDVFKSYSFCFRDLFCWQEIRSQQLNRYRYLIVRIYILLKSKFHTLTFNIKKKKN